jgi:hypothetical protein
MHNTERTGDPVARGRDVNIRGVFLFAFWLAVGSIAISAAMWGLFRFLARQERSSQPPLAPAIAVSLKRTPPEPRLEPYPLLPRQRLRAEEEAVLGSYGWVDKPGGVVRIPIERAMEVLVQRGLPPSKPMAAPAPMPLPGAPPAAPAEQKR